MATKSRKTEHSGSKKGAGSYWGRKEDAKHESNRKRREESKQAVRRSKLKMTSKEN